MKKQELSKIMKDAWMFFRTTGQEFSECLKRAWANFKLLRKTKKRYSKILLSKSRWHFKRGMGDFK